MDGVRIRMMIGIILVSCLLGVGCSNGESDAQATREYNLYYLNVTEDKLVSVKYPLSDSSKVELVDELVSYLKGNLENYDYKPVINEVLNLERIVLYDTTATLFFDKTYLDMDPIREILVRAGLVKSLTQIPGVEHVSIQVDEQPLTNVDGSIVGPMTSKMFMDSAKNDFDDYDKIKLVLYYANADRDELVAVTEDVVYMSDITIERLVVEELLKGPETEGVYPTLNPEVKIVNIATKDGVCYVNLDTQSLTPPEWVSAEVTIYSIVNSLVELSNINKVQISINGDTNYTYLEQIPLSTILERNLEIVE